MKSLSSFIGKCLTVLVGMALSWVTVTMPEVESLAAKLCGVQVRSDNVAQDASLQSSDQKRTAGIELPAMATQHNPNAELRIQEISQRLKRLGASYLLLEKLPQGNSAQYRVRCDLANQHASLKCCFEATRGTALAAMEEVLRAVRQSASQGDISRSAVATSI